LLDGSSSTVSGTPVLAAWLRQRAWKEAVLETGSSSALRTLDERLSHLLPPADAVRQNWLRGIPRYQRSAAAGARVVWLTETEQALLDQDPHPGIDSSRQ
jgi:hypothetical protein